MSARGEAIAAPLAAGRRVAAAASLPSFLVAAIIVGWAIDLSPYLGSAAWSDLISPTRWALCLAAAGLGVRLLLDARSRPGDGHLALFACLLGPPLLSMLATAEPATVASQSARLFSLSLLGIGLLTNPATARGLLTPLVATCAVLVALSVLGALLSSPQPVAAARIRTAGITVHPNALGVLAGCVALHAWSNLLSSRRRRWVSVALLATGLAGVAMSDSRGAMLFLAALLGLVLLWRLTSGARSRAALFLAAVVVLAGLALLPLASPLISVDLSDGAYSRSDTERLSAWSSSLASFADHPLLGVGYGVDVASGTYAWNGRAVLLDYSHNLLLNSLRTMGLLGLVHFGAVFGLALLALRRLLTQSGCTAAPVVSGAAIALLVFGCSCLDGSLQAVWYSFPVFFVALAATAPAGGGAG